MNTSIVFSTNITQCSCRVYVAMGFFFFFCTRLHFNSQTELCTMLRKTHTYKKNIPCQSVLCFKQQQNSNALPQSDNTAEHTQVVRKKEKKN